MKVEELAGKTLVTFLFESLLNEKGTCTLTRLSTLTTSGKEKNMAPVGQIRPVRQRQRGSHDRVGARSRKTKGSSGLKVGATEG